MLWSLLTPIIMLAIYTFVFTVVFHARWEVDIPDRPAFAMVLYVGIIVVSMVTECLTRAPTLLLNNQTYVKNVVFPIEILPWVQICVAIANAGFALVALTAAHLLTRGALPLTALWLPVLLAPMLLMVVGGGWLLASMGVFLRDIGQVVTFFTTMLLFVSPVFYPITALPPRLQGLIYLNPATFPIEQARAAFLFGQRPDFVGLAIYTVVAWLVAWGGLLWFQNTRRGFADVM